MKKNLFRMVMAGVLALSMLFTACGGSTGTTTPTSSAEQNNSTDPSTETTEANFVVPEVGYDGSEVTITFYHTMGSSLRDVLDAYIEEFNKLYPNIHVEHEQTGGYDDVRNQISTELTVGGGPNIAYCYPDHVALYNIAGATVQLDNLIDSQIEVTRADGTTEILGLTDAQKSDFIEGYYNEGLSYGDGHMYTLPFSKSTEVLYYNKTFFDANGLSVPTTWDEMEDLIQMIKLIDPSSTPLGYDSEANWFITMCEQGGSAYTSATGEHFLFNNDANKAFVKRFRNWYQKGYVTTQQLNGDYTSNLFTATTGTRCYMSIGSSAGATHQRPTANDDGTYPFEVGIASIPQLDTENPKVISQGPSIVILNKTNPQEVIASWLFVKFLTTSAEFQAEFSMASGYVPVIKSVSENAIYADFLANADGGNNIAALAAKVCLDQESAYYVSPAFNGSSKARDAVGALMQACFILENDSTLDADIDAAFEKAIADCK